MTQLLTKMKSLLFFFLFLSTGFIIGQDNAFMASIEWQVVYRGYANHFEYAVCDDCDTVFLSAIGADLEDVSQFGFNLTPQQNMRRVSVTSNCVKNQDTLKSTWRYSVHSLPKPNIYLGGINLEAEIDHVPESTFFAQERFSARYDEHTPLTNVYFTVSEWSISVGKDTFIGKSPKLSEAYKSAYFNAKRNAEIRFNYVIIQSPDGTNRKIELNRVYLKKSKKRTEIEVNSPNYLTPEKG